MFSSITALHLLQITSPLLRSQIKSVDPQKGHTMLFTLTISGSCLTTFFVTLFFFVFLAVFFLVLFFFVYFFLLDFLEEDFLIFRAIFKKLTEKIYKLFYYKIILIVIFLNEKHFFNICQLSSKETNLLKHLC